MKIFATLLFIIFSITANAQLVTKNFTHGSKESYNISLKQIEFLPERIWLNFDFKNPYGDGNIYLGSQTDLGIKTFYTASDKPLLERKNINASGMSTSKNKTYNFSAGFRFCLPSLLGDVDYEDMLQSEVDFFLKGNLELYFWNCTSDERSSLGLKYGDCFNIPDIKLNMHPEKWMALYAADRLNAAYEKDEFETTADYKKRTSPDSVKAKAKNYIDVYFSKQESVYYDEVVKASKQDITYNADKEEFTLKYDLAEPVIIKVKSKDARTFKEGVLDGSITCEDFFITYNTSGKLVFRDITFKQNGKEILYENLAVSGDRFKKMDDDLYVRVQADVKKLLKDADSEISF